MREGDGGSLFTKINKPYPKGKSKWDRPDYKKYIGIPENQFS